MCVCVCVCVWFSRSVPGFLANLTLIRREVTGDVYGCLPALAMAGKVGFRAAEERGTEAEVVSSFCCLILF